MTRKPRTIKRMTIPKTIADQLRVAITAAMESGQTLNGIAVKADVKQSVLWRFMRDPAKKIHTETAEALAMAVGMRLKLTR